MRFASSLKLWWRAVRPYAYPASIVPVFLGTAIAWSEGVAIDVVAFVLVLVGVVAAHTGGNLINDYEDFRRGVDRPGTLGGNGLLVSGEMTPARTLAGAAVALSVALCCGVLLALQGGWMIWVLMGAGALAAIGYGMPPFGFKYRALGDVTVFFAFGVGVTLGSYFAQVHAFSWVPVAAAVPYGLWVVALLHCNNIRDMADDAADRTRTLAGALGPRGARIAYAVIVLGSYATVAAFSAAGVLPRGALLVFATLPMGMALAVRISAAPPASEALAAAVPRTAQFSLFFGVALIAGIAA